MATLGQLSVEGVCLPPGRITKLCPVTATLYMFAIYAQFTYKTVCAPTKTKTDVTPIFMLLSRIFLSAIEFQRSGRRAALSWQRTNAARRFVDTSGSLPFVFTLTQWLASTIYEEEGP
jgi:hypothetical protein